jgi:hypothetical protein
MLPQGVTAKKLPVIVKIHGGPWTREVWGFDPEVQFLANRGIGVLQVNSIHKPPRPVGMRIEKVPPLPGAQIIDLNFDDAGGL